MKMNRRCIGVYTKADQEDRKKWMDEKCKLVEEVMSLMGEYDKNIHTIIHKQIRSEILMLKMMAMDVRYNRGLGLIIDCERTTRDNLDIHLTAYQTKIRPFEVEGRDKDWRKEDG